MQQIFISLEFHHGGEQVGRMLTTASCDAEVTRRPRLKVVGVGGAGCNVLLDSSFENIAVCTSNDHVREVPESRRLVIDDRQLSMLQGTDPRTLSSIDHQLKEMILESIGDSEILYICAGLGGETGTYVAPAIAHICRRKSDFIVMSLALPFSVEGKDRRNLASRGLSSALNASDMVIIYENDRLLRTAPYLPLSKAFKLMDDIMLFPAFGMEKALTVGDLHDLRAMFSQFKRTVFCAGMAGSSQELLALQRALDSPWCGYSVEQVGAVLLMISSDCIDDFLIKSISDETERRFPKASIKSVCYADSSLRGNVRVMALLGTPP
ncbi:MAG: hypothetical protein QHH00_00805 [Methanomassiliicoccales archaeon]|jgi:cell division protein FtsZ|nr:hypothetical protein [Methanomassiliicoccales archaeon]